MLNLAVFSLSDCRNSGVASGGSLFPKIQPPNLVKVDFETLFLFSFEWVPFPWNIVYTRKWSEEKAV